MGTNWAQSPSDASEPQRRLIIMMTFTFQLTKNNIIAAVKLYNYTPTAHTNTHVYAHAHTGTDTCTYACVYFEEGVASPLSTSGLE